VWKTSALYNIDDPDDLQQLKVGYDKIRHLLRRHRAAGGRVLGGSDTYISVPGISTQRELLFLVDTGFTELEAISMCTLDNAAFMNIDDQLGSIEPGKLADLLVLDENPLTSIDNIRAVAAVFRGGEPVDLDGASNPLMPTPRPEMVRPLWVERRLIAGGYEFSDPSFAQPREVSGGCC
jgi:imidazolonepropionase-like amidohydrolase